MTKISPSAVKPAKAFISFYSNINQQSIGALSQHLLSYARPLTRNDVKIKITEVHLFVSSLGGQLETVNSFCNMMRASASDLKIFTYNIGCVASAAVPLFCIASKRFSLPDGRFLLHEATLATSGELKRIKDDYVAADEATKRSADMISKACKKKNSKTVLEDINHHKFLNATEAKRYGLVHSVISQLPQPAELDEVLYI